MLCILPYDFQSILGMSVSCNVSSFWHYREMNCFRFFAAEPKYIKITNSEGNDISNSHIGPFKEDQEVRLVCESGGGKPIPKVSWFSGSKIISGL